MLGIVIVIALLYKFILPAVKQQFNKSSNFVLNREDTVKMAADYCEGGQLTKAVSILENYIKVHPDDSVVRNIAGIYLIKKQLFAKAEKQFNCVLKKSPNDKEAMERLGDCYFYQDKYNKAVEIYAELLKQSPDNHESRIKFADSLVKINRKDVAVKEYRTVITKDYYNTDARKKLANLYYAGGEYKRAVEEFKEIIKTDETDIDSINKCAAIYSKTGDLANAAITYKKAIDLDESDIEAYFKLANLYIKMKNYDKALRMYNDLIEKGYEVTPEMQYELATIYFAAENYEKTMSICRQLLKEKAAEEKALFLIAISYEKLNQFEEAFNTFKDLIVAAALPERELKYKQQTAELLSAWGEYLFNKENYTAALDKFVEALHYNLQNPKFYYLLGKTNHAVKNYDSASSHFDKALEFKNIDIDIMLDIARIYEETENNNTAIEIYYEAVKKEAEHYEARQALGIALGAAGFHEQAKTELARAVKLEPENPDAYFNYGLAFELLDDYEKAEEQYKKALDLDPDHEEAGNNLEIITERRQDVV